MQAAHEGTKVHAIVLGPDRLLYTGGDDKVGAATAPEAGCVSNAFMCL